MSTETLANVVLAAALWIIFGLAILVSPMQPYATVSYFKGPETIPAHVMVVRPGRPQELALR